MKKMKRILVAIFIVLISTGAVSAGERGIFAEFGVGIPAEDMFFNKLYSYIPRLGYQINEKWKVGAFARVTHSKYWVDDNYFNYYGVYGEYRIFDIKGFSMFVDGLISHNHQIDKGHAIDGSGLIGFPSVLPSRPSSTEAGLTPGISYTIPVVKVSLKVRYGFVGFCDAKKGFKEFDGCAYHGCMIADWSKRRLEFTVGYTLRF